MNAIYARLMAVLAYSHTIYCPLCPASFGTEVELADHLAAVHGGRS